MSTSLRLLSIPLLAFILLIGMVTSLRAQSVDPAAAAAPLACDPDGVQSTGAIYRICMPAANWNGDLIIYAHGYVSPGVQIALPPLTLPGAFGTIDTFLTAQGFAFATTSYHRNGLAMLEGVEDLVDLANLFVEKHGLPNRTILLGVSEGGAISVLALERHPSVFDGALAGCGPYGSFQGQVDYFGDFRVVFDYFFPGVLPPSPIDIPAPLTQTWEITYYANLVKPIIMDPANQLSVTQVISVTGAPIDSSSFPTGTEKTFERLLWYNVIATNDATKQLGGNPFGNQGRPPYAGSLDDNALNAGVQRFAADPVAIRSIVISYETTGQLKKPLVTLHNKGDPVIPYSQVEAYKQKVQAAGSAALYTGFDAAAYYGHCEFGPNDLLPAFTKILQLAPAKPKVYLPLIAAP